MTRVLVLLALAALAAAGYALRQPQALWAVVQLCALDARLTGSAFPCLEAGPEAVVLRPFRAPDLILVPTRKILGVEDEALQSPQAPNYFAAAWRARRWLGPTDWDAVAVVVNPAVARSQAQLHLHIGCLHPEIRAALSRAAPSAREDAWAPLPEIVPHIAFWGRRVAKAELDAVEPFRAAAEALSAKTADRAKMTLGVAGVRVGGAEQLLIFVSYAGAPHSWWPVAAENMVDTNCPKSAPQP